MDEMTYIKRILKNYPIIKRKPPEQRTRREQRRIDGIETAIKDIETMRDGEQIKLMIKRVYFTKTHTLYGAALLVPVSERTVKRWNRIAIETVSKVFDLP